MSEVIPDSNPGTPIVKDEQAATPAGKKGTIDQHDMLYHIARAMELNNGKVLDLLTLTMNERLLTNLSDS